MGCVSSKPAVDTSGKAAKKRGDDIIRKPLTSIPLNPKLDPSSASLSDVPDLLGDMNEASHLTSKPRLANQLTDTKAVSLAKGKRAGAHHLKNVFAPPLDVDLKSFRAPFFPKTEHEKDFIREALEKNFVFDALTENEIRTIVDAFESCDFRRDEVLIEQGDIGDYFYIVRHGKARFELNGEIFGYAKKGRSFGELALLYTSPRAASVIAEKSTTVYRVDQKTFRYIMQSQTLSAEGDKKNLLKGVTFFQDLEPSDINKLVHTMTPRKFEAGEYIVIKGEEGDTFYVIQEGNIKVADITIGSTNFEDQKLGPGDYFGERSLIVKEPRSAHCIAETDGIALTIDKDTFEKVVGKLSALVIKSEDKRKLAALKILQSLKLSQPTLNALASQFKDRRLKPNAEIIAEGRPTSAALYFVRKGKVRIKTGDGSIDKIIDEGGYFGDDMLELDIGGMKKTSEIIAGYTVSTFSDGAVVGILSIRECRNVLDTTRLSGEKSSCNLARDGVQTGGIKFNKLKKHGILGAGTFGQVWLVTNSASRHLKPYALKIQSKYELIQNHQAKGVIQEKNLLLEVRHPFVIDLVETYQDEDYLYLLLGLVQGGELFSLVHQTSYDGMREIDAKFYGSAVLEGLSHIHRQHVLYRDLKAENVLIDCDGYPVIVDFGFAKYVPAKTYTLCGTPLYLAPEVILNRGHDKGADHWSFGVLLFEMIAGYTPFYDEGMDQLSLFRRICKGEYQFPPAGVMSMEVEDLLQRFFILNPTKRIGSLSRGINEIYAHLWFDSIDFGALRHKEVNAPWVPDITDPLDKSNFENMDHLSDKTLQRNPPLTAEQQRLFEEY